MRLFNKKRFMLFILDHKTDTWLLYGNYEKKEDYEKVVNELYETKQIYGLDEYMVHDKNMEIS